MDEVINVDSSDAEDDSDDVSLFSDEVVASLLREEAEDPIEAKAEADAIFDRFESFRCPIGWGPFKDAVVCKDGVTYERDNINQWLQNSKMSPITRVNISNTTQYRNIALMNAMEEFKEYKKDTLNKLKKSEDAQNKLLLAMTTTKKMLNAAIVIYTLVGNSVLGFRFLGLPEFGIPLPISEFRNFPAEKQIGKPENRSSRKSEFRYRFFRNSGIPLITYIGTKYFLIL